MKKSKIKLAIKKAMANYYAKGLTMTAYNVQAEIFGAVDREYKKKHK